MPRLRNGIQVAPGIQWFADYPVASTFFDDLFTCRAIVAGDNFGRYCNPAVDRQVAEAETAELIDPTQARILWTKIDRLVVDDAPIIATYNAVDTTLVSTRVGNYENTPLNFPRLDQMWVH